MTKSITAHLNIKSFVSLQNLWYSISFYINRCYNTSILTIKNAQSLQMPLTNCTVTEMGCTKIENWTATAAYMWAAGV